MHPQTKSDIKAEAIIWEAEEAKKKYLEALRKLEGLKVENLNSEHKGRLEKLLDEA